MKTGELVHHLRVLDCEQCYLCRECKGPHKLKCFLFGEAADTLEAQQKRIKELEKEQGKPLTAFLSPIDAYKGLKRKFLVFKSDAGEMVENCFVLCPGNDPAAVEALRAYARATNNATLSADIFNWVGKGRFNQ